MLEGTGSEAIGGGFEKIGPGFQMTVRDHVHRTIRNAILGGRFTTNADWRINSASARRRLRRRCGS
jgi:hypothetical protein